MEAIDALKHGDLGRQAYRAMRAAGETVTELVPPASDRLRKLADRANADGYLDQVKDFERHHAKRAKKLERKLEQQVKMLPVDTPLDRHRRSRTRRRSAKGAGALVALAAIGCAIAYVVWRGRRPDAAETGPLDRFEPTSESLAAPPSANQGNGGAARQRTG